MKKVNLLIVLLSIVFCVSCHQNINKYDFSKIQSRSEVNTLIRQIENENKDVKLDTVVNYNNISVKGMHYDGVPIKNVVIMDNKITLKTDTLNFSGNRVLEAIEAKKGLTLMEDSYWDNINFIWKSETEDFNFKLTLQNGIHLAKLGDKDNAELTISYKPIYKQPLANVHKKIKTFDKQPQYNLKVNGIYNSSLTIIVNDIIVVKDHNNGDIFNIQEYITDQTTSVKVIAKPRNQNPKENTAVFKSEQRIYIVVSDKSSEAILYETSEKVKLGKTKAEIEFEFNSKLPVYPKAWSNGVDLRNDKNLKEKVKTLYHNLGNAFLTKNEQKINDMLYQLNFETQQLYYDTNFETARENWEYYAQIQNNSYKYTIADEFKIEYNANGKLLYTYAVDKPAMLTFTGKKFSKKMNFFLYQPEDSDELKIIR